MYNIRQILDSNSNLEVLEIENSDVYAKIFLNMGASLQELILDGHHLIKDLKPLKYSDTYASSILFPFANRIKDGTYKFQDNEFKFNINEEALNNALHGLVYNKTFQLVAQEATETSAMVKLVYLETELSTGFPYKYTIELEYHISNSRLNLKVKVKNKDDKTFPFTLGWHPYFLSDNLFESTVDFEADKTLEFDDRNITIGVKTIENNGAFEVKDKSLDDCFPLKSDTITFNTPAYSFDLKSSDEENFLQMYTPPHANTIAIEPTTGVSDSFNNGMGLKTLGPNEAYEINWTLELKSKKVN
ncbi:aldose 1-epimerase [Gaetbulibacter saemankumensis]|uniref:aldose 1-epimerase n=1 Tax=Gaetbulibacter saemankumensis TaxID=311208 RepID=UPI00068541F2|nr:aldose 1-epimerase [Gaetbulibacter saemankumensis]